MIEYILLFIGMTLGRAAPYVFGALAAVFCLGMAVGAWIW